MLERAVGICQEAAFPIFFPFVAAALGAAYALDVHFVSSVPVGAGLVPAQPRATTRVAPTLRLAMDL